MLYRVQKADYLWQHYANVQPLHASVAEIILGSETNPLIPDYPGIIGLSMHVWPWLPTVPGM